MWKMNKARTPRIKVHRGGVKQVTIIKASHQVMPDHSAYASAVGHLTLHGESVTIKMDQVYQRNLPAVNFGCLCHSTVPNGSFRHLTTR